MQIAKQKISLTAHNSQLLLHIAYVTCWHYNSSSCLCHKYIKEGSVVLFIIIIIIIVLFVIFIIFSNLIIILEHHIQPHLHHLYLHHHHHHLLILHIILHPPLHPLHGNKIFWRIMKNR